MLTTIKVEIDSSGHVHALEPVPFRLRGRAYLTMLPDPNERLGVAPAASSTAARALELLDSPRFVQRPLAAPEEVRRRIDTLRND